jgi:DNA-binding YbaB/EbfC family protein
MFQGLSNIGTLLKQAGQIRGQMGQMTEKLKGRRATGSAGGGMVEIEVNGLMEVLRCSIDESLVAGGDRELLEDLVVAAMNQTILKGKQLHAEVLGELTGGMQLPGLQEAMAKFMGMEAPAEADVDTSADEKAGAPEDGPSEETDDAPKPEG